MNADYQYMVGKIQQALATDPRVNKLDVKIMIIQGRVHLTGSTSSEQRKRAIAQVVSETVPGLEVRNDLSVIEISQPSPPEVICD
ncbi:MAG TPA: BON domain-containing protein [Blastocatellia bacterium]|nr:BON domain-containing protein [Blastocatellia bacterium]